MSHEIMENDALGLRDKAAWHGLGTIISEDLGAREAAQKFGVDYEVEGWPLLTRNPLTGELVPVDTHRANVRQIVTPEGNIASVLGVVGESYKICQNLELADFMDALADSGRVVIETCGTIRNGKRIWFLARSDAYDVKGGDKVYSYLLGTNTHDGSSSIVLQPTDIRVVCKNTANMVVPIDVVEGSLQHLRSYEPAAISIRHTGSISEKLAEAKRALRQYDVIKAQHRELVHQLADTPVSREQAIAYFAQQYSREFVAPVQGDDRSLFVKRQERMDKAAAQFLQRFDSEVAKFGGESAWIALNAWSGYCQHDVKSVGKSDAERRENRIRSVLFGVGSERTSRAIVSASGEFLSV